MKLYFFPGACSLASHIVLREAGLPFELEKVNLGDKKTAGGSDFREINPKGYVPALRLDDGEVLTEGPAILQYLADKVPEKQLVPATGAMARYRLIEWLNFISTELHKSFSPLFRPNTPDGTKQAAREIIGARLDFVEKQLLDKAYLTGNQFCIADAYLFTVLGWARFVQFDLSRWPAVQTYMQRVGARPAVLDALKAEGLIDA